MTRMSLQEQISKLNTDGWAEMENIVHTPKDLLSPFCGSCNMKLFGTITEI